MLQFLPLPLLWLLFYGLGRIPAADGLRVRRFLLAAASLILLLGSTGVKTTALYAAIGLSIVLAGLWIKNAADGVTRIVICVTVLTCVAMMIGLYLGFRLYVQKFFVYLPSISYLGFRGIAYLVSAQRSRRVDLSGGLMQMFFYPILAMGPITRVENFDEIRRDDREVLRRLAMAFPMLIVGHLFGRMVLEHVALQAGLPAWRYWAGAIANSFEFYLTFAGYSHLAIGLGLVAGFRLPENFHHPYTAISIGDFWRRWHMSLSYWIRDYLYIPLGGNRKGLVRKCANLLLAMGVCGIWHGLEMHYLVWGLYHGALLAIESVMSHFGWQPLRRILGRSYRPIKACIVFGLVTFSWLLFKYPMGEFTAFVKGMISW